MAHTSYAPNESHGGLSHKELLEFGIDPTQVLDFSVNINPYGPSPKVIEVIRQFEPSSYPDRDCFEIRSYLANLNHVTPEHILMGNGTAELIILIAHAFLRKKKVLIFGPTFGEYERASRMVGASVVIENSLAPDFRLDLYSIESAIQVHNPDVIFLCNPNNPTGYWLSEEEILKVIFFCKERLLILDEAYRGFVLLNPFGQHKAKNVIQLRSMTKDFSLAGVRIGYALADPAYISIMQSFQPSWSVNDLAQQAGLAALNDLQYLTDTLRKTKESAISFRSQLVEIGVDVASSSTHFFLVNVTPSCGNSFRRSMLAEKIQVRDCASFGLERWIRIGTHKPEENRLLIDAWKKLGMNGSGSSKK